MCVTKGFCEEALANWRKHCEATSQITSRLASPPKVSRKLSKLSREAYASVFNENYNFVSISVRNTNTANSFQKTCQMKVFYFYWESLLKFLRTYSRLSQPQRRRPPRPRPNTTKETSWTSLN